MVDIGACRERAALLELRQIEPGIYAWAPVGMLWLRAERQRGRNLFSAVGLGAESWRFTGRKREVTLHHALRWRGEHYFLTAVGEAERGRITLDAARIQPHTAHLMTPGGWIGPVILTEKYMGHEQTQAPALVTETAVAVTPKVLDCRAGDLLEVNGRVYRVTVCHRLDPCKNEYELEWEEDA